MSKKFFKAINLSLAVFLMTISFGACKKNSENQNKTRTATASIQTQKTVKTSGNEVSKSVTSTGTALPTDSQTQEDEEGQGDSSSDISTTTEQEMSALTDNTPNDNVDIIHVDQNMDLGGKTIKIVYDTNASGSPGDPPNNLEAENNPKAFIRYNTIEEAKKKMNFNIDWIYRSHDNMVFEYMDACASGTKYADILLSATKRVFPALATKKLLVPIDNFVDFNNDPLYNVGYLTTGTQFLGRRWGLSTTVYGIGYVTFYNKDIFMQEGLQDLQEVYRQGNWTWDTMLEYAKKATHDTNSDGAVDQWGVLLSPLDTATNALILSNGGEVVRYDEAANTYKFDVDNKAKNALKFMNDLVKIYKVTTPSSGVKFERFPSAMVIGKGTGSTATYRQYGINCGMVPMPKGPDVSETQYGDDGGVTAYFIPVNTDPKVAAAVIREAFTFWDTNKAEYLTKSDMLKGSLANLLPGGSDIDEAVKNFSSPKQSVLRSLSTFRNDFNKNIIVNIGWTDMTPDQTIETYSSALQESLNNVLKP